MSFFSFLKNKILTLFIILKIEHVALTKQYYKYKYKFFLSQRRQ
jgi:hypothetical protein